MFLLGLHITRRLRWSRYHIGSNSDAVTTGGRGSTNSSQCATLQLKSMYFSARLTSHFGIFLFGIDENSNTCKNRWFKEGYPLHFGFIVVPLPQFPVPWPTVIHTLHSRMEHSLSVRGPPANWTITRSRSFSLSLSLLCVKSILLLLCIHGIVNNVLLDVTVEDIHVYLYVVLPTSLS